MCQTTQQTAKLNAFKYIWSPQQGKGRWERQVPSKDSNTIFTVSDLAAGVGTVRVSDATSVLQPRFWLCPLLQCSTVWNRNCNMIIPSNYQSYPSGPGGASYTHGVVVPSLSLRDQSNRVHVNTAMLVYFKMYKRIPYYILPLKIWLKSNVVLWNGQTQLHIVF